MDKKILDQQSQHWESNFSSKPEMFGLKPSIAAVKALKIFKKEKITKIIELGAGLGRDTIYFARNSIFVDAIDYSPTGIKIINKKAKKLNLSKFIKTKIHDIRQKLPFPDRSFQGCFSHMLYCMALSSFNLKNLNQDVCRVLKSGGINVYTVRHNEDGDYQKGIHRGEDLYENDGFIVHFFSKNKINQLSTGFEILDIEKFEEGKFPRKLFKVTLKKKSLTR